MEGDAGTRQLNPTDADETPDESLAVSTEHQTEQATELQSPQPADQPAGDGRRVRRTRVRQGQHERKRPQDATGGHARNTASATWTKSWQTPPPSV